MELLKNPTLVTVLLIIFSVIVLALGIYREALYREKGNQMQRELVEMQKRILEEQTTMKNTVNQLVNQGKIPKEAAKEILDIAVKSQVTVEGTVIRKPSPGKKEDTTNH